MTSIHQVKTILIVLLMTLTPWLVTAEVQSTSPIKKFIRTLSKESRQQVNKIGLGRIPLSIGRLFVEKEYRRTLRGIKKVRILHIETPDAIPERKVELLLKNIKQKQFEPMIIINDGNSKFQLLFNETGKKIKNLILLAIDGQEVNVIELKVKIKPDQIESLFDDSKALDFLQGL